MKKIFCAIVALSLSAGAQAQLFSDNFNANTPALNTTPAGWGVTGGTIDIIGPGFYDYYPGTGYYVDLDGSTSTPGLLSRTLTLTTGITYKATFDLAGSHVPVDGYPLTDLVNVSFGTTAGSYTRSRWDSWATSTLLFTPSTTGSYVLSFQNLGGDNVGALLDNVSVAAVPEPETWAMMLAGLSFLGWVSRRRRQTGSMAAA